MMLIRSPLDGWLAGWLAVHPSVRLEAPPPDPQGDVEECLGHAWTAS